MKPSNSKLISGPLLNCKFYSHDVEMMVWLGFALYFVRRTRVTDFIDFSSHKGLSAI